MGPTTLINWGLALIVASQSSSALIQKSEVLKLIPVASVFWASPMQSVPEMVTRDGDVAI